MAAILIGNWWALALRGAAAILFGIVAFAAPGLTAVFLIVMFGAYALVDGIFAFVAAQRAAHRHGRSWPLVIEGVLDIVVALICFAFPGQALIGLIYVLGFWALLSGVALIGAGITLLRLNGHLLMILAGFLSLLLGLALLLQPGAGILVLAWWLGAYALVFGGVMVAAAFRLRRHRLA